MLLKVLKHTLQGHIYKCVKYKAKFKWVKSHSFIKKIYQFSSRNGDRDERRELDVKNTVNSFRLLLWLF